MNLEALLPYILIDELFSYFRSETLLGNHHCGWRTCLQSPMANFHRSSPLHRIKNSMLPTRYSNENLFLKWQSSKNNEENSTYIFSTLSNPQDVVKSIFAS